jgi:hypothetical protein
MAVWFTLNINDQRIGAVEIRRREPLDLSDPAAIADVWSTYNVWRDGKHMGDVRHCYGHGAWKLLALVADLIAAADLAERSQIDAYAASTPTGRSACACCGRHVAPLDANNRCGHCGANRSPATHAGDQPCRIAGRQGVPR